jgi:hypothetical protein
MLIQVHRIDENGFYLEPVLIESEEELYETVTMFEETPDGERVEYTIRQKRADIVEIDPPEGLYKPKWTGEEWTEGLTPEEIAERTNVPVPESVEQKAQRLESENADLREQLAETNANVESLTNALIELGVI